MRIGRQRAAALSEAGVVAVCVGAIACTGVVGEPHGEGSSEDTQGMGNSGGSSAATTPFVAYESVARRLSQAELNNTVRDLLGDGTSPATKFLGEDEFAPYDNDYTLQAASQALIDSLEAMASDVALRVVADPAMRALVVPCTPASAGDTSCFRQVVERLGQRAFRRSLATDEVDAYMGLLAFATEDNAYVDNDFYTAVELLIRAVLQDPEFLYRIETGTPTETPGIFALDSYEIATRLSYLLWGSTPDAQLLDAAQAGGLSDAAPRRAAAERLLADPRARAQLHRFHAMWLGYRAIPHPADLVVAFNRETTALIDRVVFDEGRSYLDLFSLEETYLDTFLANHYGLSAPAGGLGWVPYGDSGRAGILSHGSVLAGFSKFSDTSPTQRGIFVRTRLLCEQIPRPPANVDVDQPPGDDESACKYDRYLQHRASSSCAACHGQMDPIGFGLENYDIAGRYRSHDDGLPECVITGEGDLPGYGTFSGPAELGRLLVQTGVLDECVVGQYLNFAVGRELLSNEQQAVDGLSNTFAGNEHDFASLVLDLVESDAFALRKEPAP
jgi:hypothetical protein